MKHKKLLLIALPAAIALAALAYFVWPENQEAAIERHRVAAESRWQQYAAAPKASDGAAHLAAYQNHLKELERLSYLKKRRFEVPVNPKSDEYKELIAALIDKSDSRPVCEWSPGLLRPMSRWSHPSKRCRNGN